MRFRVNAYTPQAPEHFPENTWDATDLIQVNAMVQNCSRKLAGISRIEILVLEPHEMPPVDEEVPCYPGTCEWTIRGKHDE